MSRRGALTPIPVHDSLLDVLVAFGPDRNSSRQVGDPRDDEPEMHSRHTGGRGEAVAAFRFGGVVWYVTEGTSVVRLRNLHDHIVEHGFAYVRGVRGGFGLGDSNDDMFGVQRLYIYTAHGVAFGVVDADGRQLGDYSALNDALERLGGWPWYLHLRLHSDGTVASTMAAAAGWRFRRRSRSSSPPPPTPSTTANSPRHTSGGSRRRWPRFCARRPLTWKPRCGGAGSVTNSSPSVRSRNG